MEHDIIRVNNLDPLSQLSHRIFAPVRVESAHHALLHLYDHVEVAAEMFHDSQQVLLGGAVARSLLSRDLPSYGLFVI